MARRILQLILDNSMQHLSSIEIVRQLSAEEPTTESTIYRTLERLVAFGVLERIQMGPGPATYHHAHHRHEHVFCAQCGQVFDVPGDLLDGAAQRLRSTIGFTLRLGQVSLQGTCADCKNRGGNESSREPAATAT